MAISICVPTYNRLPHLKNFIESIRNGIGDYHYEIIVADGGSTDGTIEYLKKQKDVTLIEMGELSGGVKAYNACFKKMKYEYVFWPSDDFIVPKGMLNKACNLMDQHSEIGLVGLKQIDEDYSNFASVGTSHDYIVLSKTHVFRTEALKKINYLDDAFRSYFVDGDSTLGVLNQGYSIIFTKGPGVIHTRVIDETLKRNRKSITDPKELNHYEQKWKILVNNIENHLKPFIIRRYKSKLFFKFRRLLYNSKIMQQMMKKRNRFAVNFYDWVLEQCSVFKIKDYDDLKDFHLAQKLPNEVINKKKS